MATSTSTPSTQTTPRRAAAGRAAYYRYRSRSGAPQSAHHVSRQRGWSNVTTVSNPWPTADHEETHPAAPSVSTSDKQDELEIKTANNFCCLGRTLVEKQWGRRFFRICALLNLLSLVFSAPLLKCSGKDLSNEDCHGVFIQYVTITSLDLVLALLYTLQTLVRIEYSVYLRKLLDRRLRSQSESSKDLHPYTSLSRLFLLCVTTVSLWYSVAIGIYRSYIIKAYPSEPTISLWWYYGFIIRSTTTASAMKLFVHLKLPSALGAMLKNIKWKQLLSVTFFYLFFIYMYALVGVQWIGGLNERCTYSESSDDSITLLSIPETHCSSDFNGTIFKDCFNDQNMDCRKFPNGSSPLNIDFRNTVYLGQFRYIVDALFAVYEASTLELWFFMEIQATVGAPYNILGTWVFYITLVFFLVFYIQQSIFLVVIIESFADIRSNSAEQLPSNQPKQQLHASTLDYEMSGTSTAKEKLRLKRFKSEEQTTKFHKMLEKYYFNFVEKGFIVMVLIDAIITSTKHTGMEDNKWIDFLVYWQLSVSILFVLEIAGLFCFHLFTSPKQLKLFIKNPYYWYLIMTAIFGLAAGIPYRTYDPRYPGNPLAVFQALRLPRVIRLVPLVKNFYTKIVGSGHKLLVVILTTAMFLVWFSVISIQLFGYLQPADDDCKRFGSDQFGNILIALQSMFQLAMIEGWTELTSEIMCHRDHIWWLINLYFIVVHLLASLILLNFFVAVILDNLDYDEEKKKEKLEKELNTRKIERVPWHLKVFKLSGPKRIPVPKLWSIERPTLTETDVRTFYEVGDFTTDIPLTYSSAEPPPTVLESNSQPQISQLQNLELLTEDVHKDTISVEREKYLGVQGIINQVKTIRLYSKEMETVRQSPAYLRTRSVQDATLGPSQFVQSEYDLYREKYRYFDRVLFCLSPKNKFRKICKLILTYQCDVPQNNPLTSSDSIKTNRIFVYWMKICEFLLRYVVSRLSYFMWVMVLINLFVISFQVQEIFIDPSNRRNPFYYWPVDLLFVVATLTELILKILANGLFLNPNAAIRSLWDILDWLIVLAALATMIIYITACGTDPRLIVTFANLPSKFRFLLFFRALRPLRLISIIPTMRRVFYNVLLGWKKFLLGIVLLFVFVFMFASLGVQLFAGNESPEGFCNDPSTPAPEECTGEFYINIEVSPQELLPISEYDVDILVPRVWYDQRRDFRFNNIGNALLTLFEVLTLEGWLNVRDIFGEIMDEDGFNWPSLYMKFYIHIFVFFGVNIGLQLFVGIVVNNYNEHKPDHSALLTVSQKRWTELIQRISLSRPIKQPPEPRTNTFAYKFRLRLYRIFTSHRYRHFITIITAINSLLLAVPWIDEPDILLITTGIFILLFGGFAMFYIIEFFLQLMAFGKGYFHSKRNIFDCGLALLSSVYIIFVIVYFASPDALDILRDVALVLSLLKLFGILMKYSTLQNLLKTVGQTILRSLSLIGVLVSFILTYSFVGNLFFQNVHPGETTDYGKINFDGFISSVTLAIRVITGEDWYQLLWDTKVEEPYCSIERGNCGIPALAIVWFISYHFLVSFILLNVVIAVLLENFSIFYNQDDTKLSHVVVKDFKQNWYYFDKKATGFIPRKWLKLLLRMLKPKRLYSYGLSKDGVIVKEREKHNVLSDSLLLREMAEELHQDVRQQDSKPDTAEQPHSQQNGVAKDLNREKYSFQSVLTMVAYRAEDISKRLVPHELYIREELEESIQFDVAEQCILMWMNRFVKPVIRAQQGRRIRRGTELHEVHKYPILLRNDSSVLWSPDTPAKDSSELESNEFEDDSDLQFQPQLEPSSPERRNEQAGLTPTLARSYAKIQEAPFVHFKPGTKDKWHDWFKMQKEWLNNVEEDPENYFDDYL